MVNSLGTKEGPIEDCVMAELRPAYEESTSYLRIEELEVLLHEKPKSRALGGSIPIASRQ